jgi:hypothetical protein
MAEDSSKTFAGQSWSFSVTEAEDGYRIDVKGDKEKIKQWIERFQHMRSEHRGPRGFFRRRFGMHPGGDQW